MINLTKKLIICICCLPILLNAQKGLEFSGNIAPGFSFLLNQNDQQNTETDQPRTSYGANVLLCAGYNFNDFVGIGSGIGYVNLSQRYIKPATINDIDKLQHTLSRHLSYFRVPLSLRIGSDPQARFSFYGRFGIQVDILLSATGEESFPITANQSDQKTNYLDLKRNDATHYMVYSPVVLAAHADVGLKLRFNDQLALLFLLHFETSLSNIEADDAPLFFNSERITIVDAYGESNFLQRQNSRFMLIGLNIGLVYTPFANQTSLSNNKRKYRPSLWR